VKIMLGLVTREGVEVTHGLTMLMRPDGEVWVAAGPDGSLAPLPIDQHFARRLVRAKGCELAGERPRQFSYWQIIAKSEPDQKWSMYSAGCFDQTAYTTYTYRCSRCGLVISQLGDDELIHPGPSVEVSEGVGYDSERKMLVSSDDSGSLALVVSLARRFRGPRKIGPEILARVQEMKNWSLVGQDSRDGVFDYAVLASAA